MKTTLCLIGLLLGFTCHLKSQTRTIEGSVRDSLSNESIPYTAISIVNQEDSLLGFVYANEVGKFRITFGSVTKGYLCFAVLGYEKKRIALDQFSKPKELFHFTLTAKAQQLNDITIEAKGKEIVKKFDRSVYDISNNKKRNANDVYDILQTLPGVVVDKNTGTIRFKGGQPEVLLSNMPVQYIYPKLEMIPIENIETIELIDRSAMYGGEGSGGIINIKIRKSKSRALGGFYSTEHILQMEKNPVSVTEELGNINYMMGPVMLFGNFGYVKKRFHTQAQTTGNITSQVNFYQTSLEYLTDGTSGNLNGNAGLFIPGNKIQLLMAAGYDKRNRNSGSFAFDQYFIEDALSDIIELESNNRSDAKSKLFISKISFDFTKDKNLSLSYQTNITDRSSLQSTKNLYNMLDGNASDSSFQYELEGWSQLKANLIRLHYNHPFNKTSRFNIHARFSNRSIPFAQQKFLVDNSEVLPMFKGLSSVGNDLYIGSNYGKLVGKIKLDGGITYHHHYVDAIAERYIVLEDTLIPINLNNHFMHPSLRITWSIKSNQTIKGGYSFTSRASAKEQYLSFTDKQNPLVWVSGNPDLKPVKNNRYYLSYHYDSDSLNFSTELFFRATNNAVSNVVIPISSMLRMSIPDNIALSRILGMDLSYWQQVNKDLSFGLHSRLGYSYLALEQYEYSQNTLNHSNNLIKQNFSNYIKVHLTYRRRNLPGFTLWIKYTSRELNVKGYDEQIMDIDFALNRRFFKNKLFVNLSFENLAYGLMDKRTIVDSQGIYSNTIYQNMSDQPRIGIYLYYIFNDGDRGTRRIADDQTN